MTISPWPGELPPGMESRVPNKWRKEVYCARAASRALYSSAISRRNRMMMRRDGAMPLVARLLKSDSPHLLVPVVGIVNQFAKEVRTRNNRSYSIELYLLSYKSGRKQLKQLM